MNKKINIVELFSGIGSQAKALQNIGFKINVLNTCEWDIHAFIAYDAIHNSSKILKKYENKTKDELIDILSKYTLSSDGKTAMNKKSLSFYNEEVLKRICSAIYRTKNLVDIESVKGSDMASNIDVLTYSFPCQDLSNVGAFHGYNKGIDPNSGSRSSLLWQVGRILNEMKSESKPLPKYLVMENVPTLLSPRHKPNFEKRKEQLEKVGYVNKEVPLNARFFGIPQNRPRLLMISVFVGNDEEKKDKFKKYLDEMDANKIINDYRSSIYYKELKVSDLIRLPKSKEDKLWYEALECTPNDTKSRRKIWEENPKIIDEKGNLTKESFIRTVTTKQDRHPNSGNIYFDSHIEGRSKFHYLTPRECMLFMGFTDNDYEKIIKNNSYQGKKSTLFPRDKIIRMAGNSIPVNLLEGFFYQIYKLEKINK